MVWIEVISVPNQVAKRKATCHYQEQATLNADDDVKQSFETRPFKFIISKIHDQFWIFTCVNNKRQNPPWVADQRTPVQELINI